eukprot:s120_g27.t1
MEGAAKAKASEAKTEPGPVFAGLGQVEELQELGYRHLWMLWSWGVAKSRVKSGAAPVRSGLVGIASSRGCCLPEDAEASLSLGRVIYPNCFGLRQRRDAWWECPGRVPDLCFAVVQWYVGLVLQVVGQAVEKVSDAVWRGCDINVI